MREDKLDIILKKLQIFKACFFPPHFGLNFLFN